MRFVPTKDTSDDTFPEDGVSLTDDKRTEARICATQALYQVIFVGMDINHVSDSFKLHEIPNRKADKKIFKVIMEDASERLEQYLKLIEAHLNEDWVMDRMDPVAKSILVAAIAELSGFPKTPAKVILNEYINISKGFLEDKDVKFVNALLDKVISKVR